MFPLVIPLFVLGLVVGSFLAAYTWRVQKGLKISSGRSICDNCGEKIPWYFNVPVFSYLILFGRAACCKKKISIRYPLIEMSTALVFALLPVLTTQCSQLVNCLFTSQFSLLNLVILGIFCSILIGVLVIDLESQLIYDHLSFALLVIGVLYLLTTNPNNFYSSLFAGFSASFILLLMHLVTKGKGMGLGDVKLALGIGIFLGIPHAFVWLYLAFLTGGLVAIILVLVGKTRLKQRIAFGPFLVVAFFLTLFFGNAVLEFFI